MEEGQVAKCRREETVVQVREVGGRGGEVNGGGIWKRSARNGGHVK